MKVLSGAVQPDAGEMRIDGRALRAGAARCEARRAGVAMIYQELSLGPHLTVMENILLGIEPARAGLAGGLGVLDRRAMRRRAVAALEELHHRRSPPTRSWAGCPSPRSRSSRSRARWRSAAACWCSTSRPAAWPRPTSSALFAAGPPAAPQGHAIVYISHFIEEVQARRRSLHRAARRPQRRRRRDGRGQRARDRRSDGRPPRRAALSAQRARAAASRCWR